MNKAQLIAELAPAFDGNRRAAGAALDAVVDAITRSVAKGEKVSITGFGSFDRLERPARTARNPRTGERVRLKKTAVPKFRAGATLKAMVADPRKLPKPGKAPVAAARRGATARPAASVQKAPAAPPVKTTAAKASPAKTTAVKTASPVKTTAAKASPVKTTAAKTASPAKTTAAKASPVKTTAAKTASPAKTTAAKASPAKKSPAKAAPPAAIRGGARRTAKKA